MCGQRSLGTPRDPFFDTACGQYKRAPPPNRIGTQGELKPQLLCLSPRCLRLPTPTMRVMPNERRLHLRQAKLYVGHKLRRYFCQLRPFLLRPSLRLWVLTHGLAPQTVNREGRVRGYVLKTNLYVYSMLLILLFLLKINIYIVIYPTLP